MTALCWPGEVKYDSYTAIKLKPGSQTLYSQAPLELATGKVPMSTDVLQALPGLKEARMKGPWLAFTPTLFPFVRCPGFILHVFPRSSGWVIAL